MSNQWPPGPPQNYQGGGYPPQYPNGQYQQAPKSNAKWYATIGALVVIIAGLLSVTTGVISVGDADAMQVTEVAEPPPVFEPASAEGADPFFPLQTQLAGFERETGQLPTQQAVATGLYGGTAENTCDPQRLIDFLMANPDKGHAWAMVQGIEYEQIPAYIGSLRVRVLAEPATVLNHGFDPLSGAPYEIETTLEAGTAVLVDENGDIRTRCYCGNPIKPKPIGHKPPRCVQVPTMVYTEPGGNTRSDGVPTNVWLTGRVTTDLSWSEISWGPGDAQIGWTPVNNLHRYLCFVVPPPPPPPPPPTPTWTPGPTPTWTPGPTPTSTPWPTPTPTWTPGPTPTPTPTWTPGPTPTPTPTSWPTPTPTPTWTPQPLQINCFITDTDLVVGEQTEFSAVHVPGNVQVTYAFDHGDGTIDRRNPSIAFYETPGSYEVYVLYSVDGFDDRQFCGTVTVKAAAPLRLGCSINNTRPAVGETITLTARTLPEDSRATFVFDHGDGYQEQANPSFAVYRDPGDYDVRVTATLDGQSSDLYCGRVSVTGEKVCSTSGYDNMTLAEAGALADSRGCAYRVVGQPGDTQYRTDRVNFTMSSHGRVQSVALG